MKCKTSFTWTCSRIIILVYCKHINIIVRVCITIIIMLYKLIIISHVYSIIYCNYSACIIYKSVLVNWSKFMYSWILFLYYICSFANHYGYQQLTGCIQPTLIRSKTQTRIELITAQEDRWIRFAVTPVIDTGIYSKRAKNWSRLLLYGEFVFNYPIM